MKFSIQLFLTSLLLFASIPACVREVQSEHPTSQQTKNPTNLSTTVPVATQTEPHVRISPVELVTDLAAPGDGGNIWGGHQTRIVHTEYGVFTAYTVAGRDELNREWRLAKRRSVNDWMVIAKGESGREPVNLLTGPDGTLYIIGWPAGVATLWSGKPQDDSIELRSQPIPNLPNGNWPYSSAGIAPDGTFCVLASNGGEEPTGEFYWSCYLSSSQSWVSQVTKLDYRYCYTYVFPLSDGRLSLISTRDVRWSALGYKQPTDAFEYAFNAIGYWQTSNLVKQPMKLVMGEEELQTPDYPNPFFNAQMDAYLDMAGNMHILYWREGETTHGIRLSMHRIVSPAGEILYDSPIPDDAGYFNRIFQDMHGHFYLLGSSGRLYLLDENGQEPVRSFSIDLDGHEVEYSGYGLSVPRTGTQLGDIIDVVFPSGNETQWLYFQIELGT